MAENGNKVVTLKDVAAHAGVSVATASAAIKGRPSGNCRMSKDVASKILQSAKLLRYRPNLYARRLSLGQSRTVALVVKYSVWHNLIWPITSAQKVLRQKHYDEIFLMHYDSLDQEARHLEMCLEARVDGILIFPLVDINGQTNARKINEIMEIEKVPIVQIGVALPGCEAPFVIADEVQGAFGAVKKLAEMGHRRIAHLTLVRFDQPQATNPFLHAHRRYSGYCKAMSEFGLTPFVRAVDGTRPPDVAFNQMVQLAREVASGDDAPTAMLVYSDSLAAAAMLGIQKAGLRVPQDISVIGVDRSPLTDSVRPILSMVALPHEQLGAAGIQMLLGMIQGEGAQSIQLPSCLEPGETLAPARRD